MPVVNFISNGLELIGNLLTAAITEILTYMFLGGWKYVFRAVSFFFDTQLVKLIGTVFSYFNQLLTMEMFNEELMSELLRNIYVFIGVIMFFRLMMLVIKYLINPDMISDAKAGVASLIKRVIIGCCGILFIPTIFDLANDLQVAILEDGIIQQLIIPRDMIEQMEDKINQGGHYIGTYVLAGFISPNSNASKSDVNQFNLGVQQGDLSNVDINEGGFLTQKFKYDYFFFISTLALGYVFYYMLKYCIDIAGRCFKLLLYKLIAPIAMIEYMINGSQDGVFKQWLTATISTYAMLFVRILAIWFVLLVTTLMGDDGGAYAGELLTNNDYFLRAIIIIALLGFMMDLPKLVGQIFGLDLEQEGSASGVLKQVGGMVKGAAFAGLAVGGAVAASGTSAIKGLQKFGNENGGLARGLINKGKGLGKSLSSIKNNPGAALKALTPNNLMKKASDATSKFNQAVGGKAVLGAAMASNQFTKAAYGGYQEVTGEQKREEEKAKAKKREDAAETRHIVSELDRHGKEVTVEAVAEIKLPDKIAKLTAEINGEVSAVASKMKASDFNSTDLRSEVQQIVTRRYQESGIEVNDKTINTKVNQIMESTSVAVDEQTQKVKISVDTSGVAAALAGYGDENIVKEVRIQESVTRTINDVQGTQIDGPGPATRTVNDVQGAQVNAPGSTTRTVNDVQGAQVDDSDLTPRTVEVNTIQRNISENTIPTRSDREIPRGDN